MYSQFTTSQILPCGRVGVAGGLGAGVDLRKYTIDTTRFRNAVCNDGTYGVPGPVRCPE
jgi:hypothetical protein